MTQPKGRRRSPARAARGIEGDAWDQAAEALFHVSDETRFITGVCLPVDGGVNEIAALTALEMMDADG